MTKGGGNGGRVELRTLDWFLNQRVVIRGRADYAAGKAFPPDFDDLTREQQDLYEWGRQYEACGSSFGSFNPQWCAMVAGKEAA